MAIAETDASEFARSAKADGSAVPAEDAPGRAIADWILREGRAIRGTRHFVDAYCHQLRQAGVPLTRTLMGIRTMHPLIAATGFTWRTETAVAEEVDRGHDMLDSDQYRLSPLKAIREGAAPIRRKLSSPEPLFDFPVLADLREQGMTDYYAIGLAHSDGAIDFISYTTDSAAGFSDRDIAVLEGVNAMLAANIELHAVRRMKTSLMRTYLGQDTASRVLAGEVTRGTGRNLNAVIWSSDLRGFTRLSDTYPAADIVDLLNEYFDAIVPAIEESGGEVLKFIGDGVLALFPISSADDIQARADQAIAAAEDAMDAMTALNVIRAGTGAPSLDHGIALHVGDVMYGNIGAPDRLDFTAIGPAVNHTSRLEELCKETGHHVLVSGALAALTRRELVSLGCHQLRGVEAPQEVFTLPDPATDPVTGGA